MLLMPTRLCLNWKWPWTENFNRPRRAIVLFTGCECPISEVISPSFFPKSQSFDSSFTAIDNKALNRASKQAQQDNIPLIALFVVSPQDYIAHDRSPRKIDFTLRNLAVLRVGTFS